MEKPGRKTVQEPWVGKFNSFLRSKKIRGRVEQINFTHPEWSQVLVHNLAKYADGLADDNKARFKSKDDPDYKELLNILEEARAALYALPRMDMPGGQPSCEVSRSCQ